MPGKDEAHIQIVCLVYMVWQNRYETSLGEARELIAEELKIHVDTVRRAWRAHKDDDNVAAIFDEIAQSGDAFPEKFEDCVQSAKRTMQEIRASRRIPSRRLHKL